jgi:TPR repeat protein
MRSCDLLGFLYEHGLPTLDVDRAFALYRDSCDYVQYVKPCYDKGRMYLEGLGIQQSDRLASDIFERTCEIDGYGCAELGHLILLGRAPGVAERAIELFEKGCDANVAESCGALAAQLERAGHFARSIEIYGRACAAGHGPSCYRLGVINQLGDIVDKNEVLAHELYVKGCALGDANACAAGARQIVPVP